MITDARLTPIGSYDHWCSWFGSGLFRSAGKGQQGDGLIVLLGLIRQEILSGIADRRQFERLREAMAAFPDEVVLAADHVRAAEHFNRCRAAGVAGSPVDFLTCPLSERPAAPIFTTDLDFARFDRHLPIHLYGPTSAR